MVGLRCRGGVVGWTGAMHFDFPQVALVAGVNQESTAVELKRMKKDEAVARAKGNKEKVEKAVAKKKALHRCSFAAA